ncbi:MAG: AhpC/TSA family protein [Bacteroidota bacterium]
MKKILFGLLTLVLISCNEKTEKVFSLTGTTNGFEDGTILYLDVDNNTIDSTKIEGNKFVFNTKLPEDIVRANVRTKNFSQYRILWLENNTMTFDASSSDFRNAVVTGSKEEELKQNLFKEIKSLTRAEALKKEMEFVNTHPNSRSSASILSVYASTWGKEKTKELYDQFSEANKNSKDGKEIARFISLNKNPKIGESFVDFELENMHGEKRKLSELKGKTVLLEFWASWCGPCRKENPNLVKTYEEFNPKGFEIFAVSLDLDKKDWLQAIKKDNLNWEHVSDLKGDKSEAAFIYGIIGIPDNFLISSDGEIIGRGLRGEQLNEKLQEIF